MITHLKEEKVFGNVNLKTNKKYKYDKVYIFIILQNNF